MGQEEMINVVRRMGVADERVLEAMAGVDRAEFVGEVWRGEAYADRPLPIGLGQTISQPYTVARMCELLISKSEFLISKSKVLEIGTGSGYQTAILAKLFGRVYSVEVVPELAKRAEFEIRNLKFENVQIKAGDGKEGWREHAPYEAIIVAADAGEVPEALIDQLATAGRLVIPVKGRMMRGTKQKNGAMKWEEHERYTFVPLV